MQSDPLAQLLDFSWYDVAGQQIALIDEMSIAGRNNQIESNKQFAVIARFIAPIISIGELSAPHRKRREEVSKDLRIPRSVDVESGPQCQQRPDRRDRR